MIFSLNTVFNQHKQDLTLYSTLLKNDSVKSLDNFQSHQVSIIEIGTYCQNRRSSTDRKIYSHLC